jgi:quercetin dioxygenase-like cupin family protein
MTPRTIETRIPVKVVHPGEGRRPQAQLDGVGVEFKIDGSETRGTLSIVEHPFAVGALVDPHVHTLEDEFSIVLEGQIGFRSEDQEVVLGAGGYIIKPRGEVHAMWNAGMTPARMIEVISPAGLEEFFRRVADMAERGAPDFEALASLADRYGVTFAQPDWLPDVVSRYNLTPPPGV